LDNGAADRDEPPEVTEREYIKRVLQARRRRLSFACRQRWRNPGHEPGGDARINESIRLTEKQAFRKFDGYYVATQHNQGKKKRNPGGLR